MVLMVSFVVAFLMWMHLMMVSMGRIGEHLFSCCSRRYSRGFWTGSNMALRRSFRNYWSGLLFNDLLERTTWSLLSGFITDSAMDWPFQILSLNYGLVPMVKPPHGVSVNKGISAWVAIVSALTADVISGGHVIRMEIRIQRILGDFVPLLDPSLPL